MKYADIKKDESIFRMAEKTLINMYQGGIFDHVGGGFSRYATDERWLVPHFEKMLYDNALLAYAYLEGFHLTKKNLYETAARRTLDYVLRELQDAGGGFYCGQDADSDGIEGKFYVFAPEEITNLLGSKDADRWNSWYHITKNGNFEGKNIPNLLHNSEFETYPDSISELNKRIYDYRLSRTNLHKDDKILSSWNGLMIAAFAKAYCVLEENQYYEAAIRAQEFIAAELTDKAGRLLLRWCQGEAAKMGILDDYAFYIFGLLELYRCHFDPKFLKLAVNTANHIMTYFYDEKVGGCFLYASDSEQLISRPKELYDGAMPSGNALTAHILMTLSALTGEIYWKDAASLQLCFLGGSITDYPTGHSASLLAVTRFLYPSGQLVCVAENDLISPKLLQAFHSSPLSDLDILIKTPDNETILSALCPFTKDHPTEAGKTAFYFCRNQTCQAPVYSLAELMQLLK